MPRTQTPANTTFTARSSFWTARGHADTLSQIIERDARPPRQLNGRVPQDLETIVLKCLRKDAGDRYGTAEAVGQDLRRLVRGDPIEARPQSGWQLVLKRVTRHKVRLSVAALVLLLGLSVGWLEVTRRRENQAVYEPAVLRSVLKIFAGRLSLEAAAGQSRSLDTFKAQNLFTDADFGNLAEVGGVEEAVAELEALVTAVPERPDAHLQLARAYSLLGRNEEARRSAALALERDTGLVPAKLLELELSDSTREEKRTALETIRSEHEKRGDWQGLWLRAQKSAREKRWQQAAEVYEELSRLRAHRNEPTSDSPSTRTCNKAWRSSKRRIMWARNLRSLPLALLPRTPSSRSSSWRRHTTWPESLNERHGNSTDCTK